MLRNYLTVLTVFLAVTLPMAAADTTDVTTPTTTQAQTAPATTLAKPEADPVVCKMLEPPLGSRVGSRRVCMTQKQWDQQSHNAQDWMQKTAPGGSPGGG